VAARGLARLCERFRRLRHRIAARGDQRVAVGHVQLLALLTSRRIRLDFFRLFKRRHQRLRLGDRWKQRRRRKAFKSGGENSVGLLDAASTVQELGEGQRG
jgi:hypothetical protein